MEKFRSVITLLFTGIVIGISGAVLYYHVRLNEVERNSDQLIDFVIAEWTGVGFNEFVDSSDFDAAQFSSLKELPMARLGYFPDTVKKLAVIVEQSYSVPSAVTLAQWALESGFGKRNLGVSNYFGHTFAATKKFVDTPRFVIRNDVVSVNGILVPGKPRKFTVYKSIAECFDVHGKYLSGSNLYKAAFYTSSPENFVRVLALHYAQDPSYATKLITIIHRYKL